MIRDLQTFNAMRVSSYFAGFARSLDDAASMISRVRMTGEWQKVRYRKTAVSHANSTQMETKVPL